MDRRWVNRGPPNYPFTLNRESPLARGLIAWWPMLASVGATTLRELVAGSHGATTSVTWPSDADRGFGANFNGSSYVNVPSVPLLRPDNITVNVWFRTASGSDAWAAIIGHPYDDEASWNTPYFSWNIIRSDVTQRLQYRITAAGTHSFVGAASAFVVGQLTMATLTYDGNTMIGYINGNEDGVDAGPSGPISYDSSFPDLMIGQQSMDSPGAYYAGDIYDVVIWNRALAPIEVAQLYAPQWELYQPLYRLQLVRVATIISLNTLTLASSPQALSVTVDEIVALNELTLVSSAPALTVITVSVQTVLVQTLTLASDTPNLIFAALIVVVFDFNITRAVTFDMGVG